MYRIGQHIGSLPDSDHIIVILIIDGIGCIPGLGEFLSFRVVGVGHGSAERVDDSGHTPHVVVGTGRDGSGRLDDGRDLTIGVVDLAGDVSARIGLRDLSVKAVIGKGSRSAEDGNGGKEESVSLDGGFLVGDSGIGPDESMCFRGRLIGFGGGHGVSADIDGCFQRAQGIGKRIKSRDFGRDERRSGGMQRGIGRKDRGHGDLIDHAGGGNEIRVGDGSPDCGSAGSSGNPSCGCSLP